MAPSTNSGPRARDVTQLTNDSKELTNLQASSSTSRSALQKDIVDGVSAENKRRSNVEVDKGDNPMVMFFKALSGSSGQFDRTRDTPKQQKDPILAEVSNELKTIKSDIRSLSKRVDEYHRREEETTTAIPADSDALQKLQEKTHADKDAS